MAFAIILNCPACFFKHPVYIISGLLFWSLMDNSGINIGSIQRILGHERRSTTDIYLHSIGDAEREAMEIFEQTSQSFKKSPTVIPTVFQNKKQAVRTKTLTTR